MDIYDEQTMRKAFKNGVTATFFVKFPTTDEEFSDSLPKRN